LRNVISSYFSTLITLATGFLLTPFILHQLGASNFGLWMLIGSVVMYGSLLDFGIAGAVIRYVAEYRARGETEQARSLGAAAYWAWWESVLPSRSQCKRAVFGSSTGSCRSCTLGGEAPSADCWGQSSRSVRRSS